MRRPKRRHGQPTDETKRQERRSREAPAESPAPTSAARARSVRHREIWYTRWLGLALCCAGFVAIAIGWSGMSGAESADAQLPYLLSGGASGLGLIVFGAALLLISQMRSDRFRHEEALAELMRRAPADEDSNDADPESTSAVGPHNGAPATVQVSVADRAAAAADGKASTIGESAEAAPRDVPAASGADR